jgi:hypothetical protein
MRIRKVLIASLLSAFAAMPAAARDSVTDGSSASVALSVMTVAVPVWAAHQGSEFIVRAVNATAKGVELSLQGVSGAIETSATIARELAEAASVGVGTSVKVVAESTGYALVASGVLLAFVPNELGRALLHHSRH